MIKIKANKDIYIDDEKLNISGGEVKNFLISSLNVPVTFDKDLTVGDFIHILYDIKDFVSLYCGEEYEVGRVLISSGRLAEPKDYLKIFKSTEITSEGVFKINTQLELSSYEEQGMLQNVSNLKIFLDDKIVDGDGILKEGVDLKSDFSLLDIIEVLYEDLVFSLKKDNLLI